jgi:hypothetical protein
MGFEFLFVVLFAAIAFGIYTHPSQGKFYAAPVPVCQMYLFFPAVRLITCDSIGAG